MIAPIRQTTIPHFLFSTNVDRIHSAMEMWVQKFIIDHGMCPFSKNSDYKIDVWPSAATIDSNGVHLEDFLAKHVKELDSLPQVDNNKRPNTLVVFPFIKKFQGDAVYFERTGDAMMNAIPGGGTRMDTLNPSCKVQAFPFHRDMNYRFKTPWPTLNLIRRYDLDLARQGSDEVSKRISLKNEETLSSQETRSNLRDILFECTRHADDDASDPTTPTVIQVTKPLSTQQMELLEAQGITVIQVEASRGNDEENASTPAISIKKKRKGSKKGKSQKRK